MNNPSSTLRSGVLPSFSVRKKNIQLMATSQGSIIWYVPYFFIQAVSFLDYMLNVWACCIT